MTATGRHLDLRARPLADMPQEKPQTTSATDERLQGHSRNAGRARGVSSIRADEPVQALTAHAEERRGENSLPKR